MLHRFSSVLEMATATPFDRHLRDVYEGRASVPDGLAFFEQHGYFDVSEAANTVQMFRENVGLHEFWHERESELETFAAEHATVYPFGSQSKVASSRLRELHRSSSGRFTLLDDDGNEVSEEDLVEMEREDRMKVQSLALDADDLAELEHMQTSLALATEVIRKEKTRFQRVLLKSFREQDAENSPSARQVFPSREVELPYAKLPPTPPPVALLDLPPYCGNVFVLRESMALLRRSWSKRWLMLDFQSSTLRMFKRRYWRSPRGVVDLHAVTKVEKMSCGDFRVELQSPVMLLLRARNASEAALWVQLLSLAMQMMQARATRGSEVSRLTNGDVGELPL